MQDAVAKQLMSPVGVVGRSGPRPGFVSRGLLFGLTALLLSLPGGAALADVIRLENNDLLHGEVTGANEKEVKFRHVAAGEVTLPWAKVVYIQTDKPVELKLLDGSVVKTKLGVGSAPRNVRVVLEGAKEPSEVSIDRILAVNEPHDEVLWGGKIALGATIQDGNTRAKSVFGGFDGERKTSFDRIEVHALYNYGETRGVLTSRNSFVRLQYSYYVWSPLYIYVGGALEYDYFKDLELRSRGGGGAGYEVFGGPDLILRFEAGAEYANEDFRRAADRDLVVARGAGRFEWQVTEWMRFAEHAELLPDVERWRDFVFRSTTSLNLKVWGNLGFAGVVIYVSDQIPAPGQGRHDATYILTLTYTF
jgi:putative salt-induced outer membrane protein YdiY